MWRPVASVLLIGLVVTACGRGEATPDPTEVARLVDEAVRATVSARVAPTCVPPTATPLPTAQPTATPQPSPEPTPTCSATPTLAPVTGKVLAEVLNVRQGPGTEHDKAGTLSEGEEVTFVELSADGEWGRLAGEGQRWVALSYVSLTGDTASLVTSTAAPSPTELPSAEPSPTGTPTGTP